MDQNIQLLPGGGRQKIGIKTKKEWNKLFIVGIVILIIVVGTGSFLFYLKSDLENKIANIDIALTALEQKRDKTFEKEILIIKKQLGLVNGLLDNHPYWTKGLTVIEDLLHDKIQVVGFDFVSGKNEIGIVGSAANYSSLAKQIASFSSGNMITDVTLQETKTQNNGTIDFTMKLMIDTTKLLKNGK